MRAKVACAVAAALGISGLAWAGRVNNSETSVDLVARTAFGSLYDTRRSADTVQYIGCSLNNVSGVAKVVCEAKDVAGEQLICSSEDPEIFKIAQGLTDNSYIFYRCDSAAPPALTYLYVSRSSLWLP